MFIDLSGSMDNVLETTEANQFSTGLLREFKITERNGSDFTDRGYSTVTLIKTFSGESQNLYHVISYKNNLIHKTKIQNQDSNLGPKTGNIFLRQKL